MTNWASLSEITKEAGILIDLIFVLFGLYIWEIFITLGFEWSLITRARKFTWPLYAHQHVRNALSANVRLVLFFLCRYSLLFALIGLVISFVEKSPIDCQALYVWNSVTGNLAILAASTSLLVRTIALWNRRLTIAIPLGILCLCHWGILCRGMFLIDAQYSAEAQSCVVLKTNHVFLNISFFSTMGVDFIILCFTIAALMRQALHSGLWKLLFKDGLVYFGITFLCNAVPAILNVINLNFVMDLIATIPAATVSTIAACRLIMRLHEFSSNGDSVYVNTAASGNGYGANQFAMINRNTPRAPEIRVTTDHYIVDDFTMNASRSKRAEVESPHDSDGDDFRDSPSHMDRITSSA